MQIESVVLGKDQQDHTKVWLYDVVRKALHPYVLLVVISLVAFGFRFYKLGEWSFWIDELFTTRDALDHQYNILEMYKVKDTANFGLEFISVTLLFVRLVFNTIGINEWSARLVAAIVGVITVPVLYFPIKKMFNPTIALVSAGLLAISTWHLYLSQNARYYPSLILFYTLALLFIYFGLEEEKPFYFLFAVLFLSLAVLERAHALLLVPVVLFYFILLKVFSCQIPRWLNRRNIIILAATPVLLYACYDAYRVFYAGDLSILSVILSDRFFGSPVLRPDWFLTGTITNIGSPLAVVATFGAFDQLRKRSRPGLFLISGAVVPLSIFMALSPFFFTALHYTLLVLPCWIILGALGITELYTLAKQRPGIMVILLGLMFILFLRDRVIRDLLYFYSEGMWASLFIALGIPGLMVLGFGLVWLIYTLKHRDLSPMDEKDLNYQTRLYPGMLLWGIAVFIILAHQVIGNQMYYEFQHGYRDNDWRSALQVVKENKLDSDLVVSAMPPVASYYLGEAVMDLKDIDFDTVLDTNRRVWFIDEYGSDQFLGEGTFEKWAAANCEVVDNFDRYMRGRIWKLNVQLCDPT